MFVIVAKGGALRMHTPASCLLIRQLLGQAYGVLCLPLCWSAIQDD